MSIDLEQRIRERAYFIWEREGRVDGCAEQHWHAAKLELTGTVLPAATETMIAVPAKKGRRKAAPVVEANGASSVAAPRARRRPAATLAN